MRLPMLLAPSIVVRVMSHSAQKLIFNERSISVTFSNYRRNQLVVSVGSLSVGGINWELDSSMWGLLGFRSSAFKPFWKSVKQHSRRRTGFLTSGPGCFGQTVSQDHGSCDAKENHNRDEYHGICQIRLRWVLQNFWGLCEGLIGGNRYLYWTFWYTRLAM